MRIIFILILFIVQQLINADDEEGKFQFYFKFFFFWVKKFKKQFLEPLFNYLKLKKKQNKFNKISKFLKQKSLKRNLIKKNFNLLNLMCLRKVFVMIITQYVMSFV